MIPVIALIASVLDVVLTIAFLVARRRAQSNENGWSEELALRQEAEAEYDRLRAQVVETMRVAFQAKQSDVIQLRPALGNIVETLRRALELDPEALGEILADVPKPRVARKFSGGPPTMGAVDPEDVRPT